MIGIRKPSKRVLAATAVLAGLGAGLAPAVAQASTIRPAVSGPYTNGANVYSNLSEGGYRGYVTGGVVMICWADGVTADGTNRWFDIYAGSISGYVNANLVLQQSKVPECS